MAYPVKQQSTAPQPKKVRPIFPAYAPPASPEAEQAVLGAILLRPEVLSQVAALLSPADFYSVAHRRIYQAMLDLTEANHPVDLVTVTARLKERGQLDGAGGPAFLAGLSEQVGFAANAAYYARLVRDKAQLRQVLDKTQEIAGACCTPIRDVAGFIDQAAQEFVKVTETGQKNQAAPLDHLVQEESRVIEEIFYHHRQPGLTAGFRDLEKLLSWTPGDLIILAARPGIGKTALAINFVWQLAQMGHRCGFFTLEMSREQLTRRFMAAVGRINGHRMNQGRMTPDEWARFAKLQEQFEAMPIWIDDAPSLSIADLRARARRQHGIGNLDFLVVDYLQLTRPKTRGRSREEEVAEVSRGLKALAKELKIPVLAVSSLNRKLEERPDKRPILSDLRESGAIEADADVVMFLYRDEVYRKDSLDKGIAELEVAKHRNGPTGMVKLAYQKEFFRFEDLAKDEPEYE
jgi:replicative DNA helicase